jgi:hypothetical protein
LGSADLGTLGTACAFSDEGNDGEALLREFAELAWDGAALKPAAAVGGSPWRGNTSGGGQLQRGLW